MIAVICWLTRHNVQRLLAVHSVCVCVQLSSSQTSRTESECSATAAAELAGKMADIDVGGGCHDDGSLSADMALADANEAELSYTDVDTVQRDEKHPDTEDAVIPSPDEDNEEGVYYDFIVVFSFLHLFALFLFCKLTHF